MNDTTPEMRQKQLEIMLAMSGKERFMHGIDMINFARMVVESGVKAANPGISEVELKIEVFKRYYRNDFPPEEMEQIIAFFREKAD